MSIRSKLLIFFPMLVLLTNTITFLLFVNANTVQESYETMMERVLSYQRGIQIVETQLQNTYEFLINPSEANASKADSSKDELMNYLSYIEQRPPSFADHSVFTGFLHLIENLSAQTDNALESGKAELLEEALSYYEKAERTAQFIREDGQQLIDTELSEYVPIYEQIQNQIDRLNSYGLYVFGINLLLSIVLAVWISRSITYPVAQLVRMASSFSKGNLNDPPDVIHRNKDELGILSDAFVQMREDIKERMKREKADLEKDRLLKEFELQALQSQINPHFLFNTLNAISKLSLLEGAERTSDLIVSVSNLLRYNLRSLDQPVTLRDEINHVTQYIAIQQARFRDKITFQSKIDPSVLECPLPCLTIQPLVENAFVHGIANKESGAVISLLIRTVGSEVWITVADNGAGMNTATRDALLRMEHPEQGRSTGIGMKNVFKRLQLFTGREDLIDIDSELGIGTKITLKLPIRLEENHVSSTHRG